MTLFTFSDLVNTTLASSITSTSSSLTLSSSIGLPSSIPAGYYFVITLNDRATRSNYEVIYAQSVSGSTLSGLLRGQEGTGAQAWLTNDYAYSGVTAGQMANMVQIGSAAGGVLDGFYPNPGMAPGAAAANVGGLGGVLTGTLPDPGMAAGAAAANVGGLGGVLTGTLPSPGMNATGVGQAFYQWPALTIGYDGRVYYAVNNFTPVQQGGGFDQGNNKIYLGWDGAAPRISVDTSDVGQLALINWFSLAGGSPGYAAIPVAVSNQYQLIVQWGQFTSTNGATAFLPAAFPHAFTSIVVCEGNPAGTWATAPTVHAAQVSSNGTWVHYTYTWIAPNWLPEANTCNYIAVGY